MKADHDSASNQKTVTIDAKNLAKGAGRLKRIGGSLNDDWNSILADQTVGTLTWNELSDDELHRHCTATISGLVGIDPKDELEGMIAAQLIAGHNAAMECYRRAMLPNQSIEGRRENLTQAGKLSRTYAMLLDALNRHRGKGQQKVTVEHVHVHSGGQAVVGVVERPGGGDHQKSADQPNAKQIANAPQSTMWSPDEGREPVPIAGDAKRAMPDARRNVTGRTDGK